MVSGLINEIYRATTWGDEAESQHYDILRVRSTSELTANF